MKTRVCIPDFGMGNLHSVERSLCRMNVNPVVSADPREIEKADKILVMADGKIVESGTHQNLIQTNGVYANLQQLQSDA